MEVHNTETMPIHNSSDVVLVRQQVRTRAAELGFSLVDQTKIVTAASELARNTLDHGRGGQVKVEVLKNESRAGLKLVFEDTGPGIKDIALAMTDGYTTGGGLGLGLSGSKRLVHDFDIESKVGQGTRITVVRWK
jgi:serine/threonine-protein kinase RsbT